MLSKASPYFKLMFESGFKESLALNPFNGEVGKEGGKIVAHPAVNSTDKHSGPQQYPEITIVSTLRNTYLVVLFFIATKKMRFGPLSSSEEGMEIDGMESLESNPCAAPDLVYNLAHLLELPDLQELALENYQAQLDESNAFQEYFSDFSLKHDEVRKETIKIVMANWDDIKESSTFQEVKEKFRGGLLGGEKLEMLFELLEMSKSPF